MGDKAEGYAASISVNEDQVVEMMALGFTASESRSALRTSNGNLQMAVEKAYKIRDEQSNIEEEEKEKARKRKLARTLGPCNSSGEDVDIDAYDRLINILGFQPKTAEKALRACDNDINKAIDWIQNNKEAVAMDEITAVEIAKVASLGFDPITSKAALVQFKGMVEEAINHLLSTGGVVASEWLQKAAELADDLEQSSTSSSPRKKISKLSKEEVKAMKSVASAIRETEDDDYSDNTLVEEMSYIKEYQALLKSLQPC